MTKPPTSHLHHKTPKKSKAAAAAAAAGSKSTAKKKASSTDVKKKKPTVTIPPPSLIICHNAAILHKTSQFEYYSYFDLQPRLNNNDDGGGVATNHSLTHDQTAGEAWRIHVGDYVCIQVKHNTHNNNIYPPGKTSKSIPPFINCNWRPCQILSIFRDNDPHQNYSFTNRVKTAFREEHTSSTTKLKVEIRWFYRVADLDGRNRIVEKKNNKASRTTDEVVFESGHVTVLDANLLLGKLILTTTCHDDGIATEDAIDNGVKEYKSSQTETRIVPTAGNICQRYYLHEEKEVLNLFTGGGGGVNNNNNMMLTRGIEHSVKLRQDNELRKRTYKYLKLSIPEKEDSSYGNTKDQNMLTLPSHSLYVKYQDGEKGLNLSIGREGEFPPVAIVCRGCHCSAV
eukprot:scaffold22056_cov60-Cyclotella_meneghiniana.AAC.8